MDSEDVVKVNDLIKQQLKEPARAFKLAKRAKSERVAERFNRPRAEVQAAVAQIVQADDTVTVTRTRREMHDYLRALYDDLATKWGFESMAHMMATAHTELVARAIDAPDRLGKEGLTALKEIAKLLFPAQKVTASRRLAAGDDREAVLQHSGHPPGEALVVPQRECLRMSSIVSSSPGTPM
jgi:hypothetical protein